MNRSFTYAILAVAATMATAPWAASQPEATNATSFSVGPGQTPPLSTHYYAIAKAVDKDALSVVQSLDEYRPQAQAIFSNAVPTGETKKYRGTSYSGIKANAYKMALIDTMAPGPGKYIPAAGLPGVKTFVEVNSSTNNPLRIADNLVIYQGAFFFDGKVFFIREGSAYSMDQ
ncbi:MAG: hypothetical protein HYV36_06230 [Lentisphaerae bacterium]|nr:hypothetical protein [Lentisphaerota bacterium]